MKEVNIFCDICGVKLDIDTGVYLGTEITMKGVDYLPTTIGAVKVECDTCPNCSQKIRKYMDEISTT